MIIWRLVVKHNYKMDIIMPLYHTKFDYLIQHVVNIHIDNPTNLGKNSFWVEIVYHRRLFLLQD